MLQRLKPYILFLLFFVGAFVVFTRLQGAEVPVTEVTAEASKSADTVLPSWFSAVLDVLHGFLAVAGLWLANFLRSKTGENQAKQEALEALRAGVTETYNTLYADFKEKAKDGKLSKEEKTALRDNAIKVAKQVATASGKAVLEKHGKEMLHSLIERIVNRLKKKKETEGI